MTEEAIVEIFEELKKFKVVPSLEKDERLAAVAEFALKKTWDDIRDYAIAGLREEQRMLGL